MQINIYVKTTPRARVDTSIYVHLTYTIHPQADISSFKPVLPTNCDTFIQYAGVHLRHKEANFR